MSEITPAVSPFDAIKRTDERGEHWTGRDLMPRMNYTRWNEFKPVIDRAMQTAANQGYEVSDLFRVNPEKSGGRPREDYRLTRFAAYLVAMNGDPRKPEVAAAQAYFAIRTREAELTAEADARPRLGDDLLDELELSNNRTAQAIAVARSERARADHFEQRAEVAEDKMRQIEGADGLTPTAFHKKYLPAVREREFFEHLYAKKYLIDQRGKGSMRVDGTFRDGPEHGHPGAKGKPYFYLHGGGVRGGRRREHARVIPGQPELDLKNALAKDGLPVNDHRTGHLFAIEGTA